jgi:hypothetical protein
VNYDLIRPCPHCPFRADTDSYLRADRAVEIAQNLARGAEFACHKTTQADPDDESECVAVAGSQFCAGALIALERMDAPNQSMRIAERLGIYDPAKLDMSAPVGTLYDFQRHHGADEVDEDTEPCGVADMGCLAPCGYLEGGVVIAVTEREATTYCVLCDTPVCEACSVECGDGRACNYHEEEDIANG